MGVWRYVKEVKKARKREISTENWVTEVTMEQ